MHKRDALPFPSSLQTRVLTGASAALFRKLQHMRLVDHFSILQASRVPRQPQRSAPHAGTAATDSSLTIFGHTTAK